ncbi:unnamed protein product [Euphydryas editha]|uniref:Reverse transcriptase domain-containing protein n=1 Tax=Euphydryas editha TaxID=104508 RepID=A0AAU9UXX9_EUPED|nr:unnamed protein product [Euphydryas editha]
MGEKIEQHENYIFYHIGNTPGLHGVGFIIKKCYSEYIQSFVGISERIAQLNITLPGYETISIIQIYAPTEMAPKDTKETFYEDLEKTLTSAHKKIVLMGDFNGQIGERLPNEDSILGHFSTGKRNDNGQRLLNLAQTHNLKILNSFFKKNRNRKWTWISPDGNVKNEIDFILSNKPQFFKDIKTINKLNFNTNHRMVRGAIYLNEIKKKRQYTKKGTPANQIPLPVPKDLLVTLKNNLPSNIISDDIQRKYNLLEKALQEVSRKLYTSKNKKDKIGDEARHLIETRKILLNNKNQNRIQITHLSKQINEKIRTHRKQIRNMTIQYHIEKSGGIKKALKELKENTSWIPSIKSKTTGMKETKRPEIMEIATAFYSKLYDDVDYTKTQYLREEDEEPILPILENEIRYATLSQKNYKAPGDDGITNEILKGCLDYTIKAFTNLYNDILTKEEIPQQWTFSNIILLHKKGDRTEINNYRPISLISNLYKIFSKVILNRISSALDENQPREQAGFRSDFSTMDHIHVVKQVIQKSNEYGKTYYLAFVDYSKAFDSLKHSYIWDALHSQGVHPKYIRIIKNIYKESTAAIQTERKGPAFKVKKGVRQGDPLSPKLFSAVLEHIFRKINWDAFGININGEKLNHLRFADDLILLNENHQGLKVMLTQLDRESKKAGLTMNLDKTKLMTNHIKTPISFYCYQIEYVDEYTYLGQIIAPENQMQKEINIRMGNAWKRFWSLKEVMKNPHIPLKDKAIVFNSCILPCLTYGAQTWALTEKQSIALRVCQNKMERSILNIKLRDKIKLTSIRSKTKVADVIHTVKKLKWNWVGHMIRNKKKKWTTDVTEWCPRDGKRKKGRQKTRWEDDIKKVAGITWQRKARNRETWKALGEAYAKGQADNVTDVEE